MLFRISVIILCSIVFTRCKSNNDEAETTLNDSISVDIPPIEIGDSAIFKKIAELDLNSYLGGTVNAFLKDVSFPYTDYIFVDDPPCTLGGAYFIFSENLLVEIVINTPPNHNALFDLKRNWNIDSVKCETIIYIKVKYKNKYYLNSALAK